MRSRIHLEHLPLVQRRWLIHPELR